MIRIATEADVPQMLAIYAPYILHTTHTFEYDVPTEEAFLQRIRNLTVQFPWLVYEEDGRILGYAYGSAPFERAAYQWCASASIYLCPEAKGKGIGKKLYTQLWHFLQLQGYRKVYAVITTANEDSIAFHRAVGYRHVATMPDCGYKLGKRYGNVWMEKELNSWDTPPGEPVPFCRVSER